MTTEKPEIYRIYRTILSEGVINLISKSEKRPATISEIREVYSQTPELFQDMPVVALGEKNEKDEVLAIYRGEERLFPFDTEVWYSQYKFLVFPKET
jgi:hypothetical protein